jgi:hypothetical protein
MLHHARTRVGDYDFAEHFGVRWYDVFNFFLFFEDCFGYLRSFEAPYKY